MLKNPINRLYVRTDNWSVSAKVRSGGSVPWLEAAVLDIAAGGMLFLADISCKIGDFLWFDMKIDPMAPGITQKIPIKVKGEIVGDRGIRDGKHAFSAKFVDLSKKDTIRIDELIRMTNYKYKLESGLDPLDV